MELFEGKRVKVEVSKNTYALGTIVRSDYIFRDKQPDASIYCTNPKSCAPMVWVYFDEDNDQKRRTRRIAGSLLSIFIEDIIEI